MAANPDPKGYDAAHQMFCDVVDQGIANPGADPKDTIHKPAADHALVKHGLLHSLLPENLVNRLEAAHHLGNFVIDRATGQKSWEHMSICVRLGMHLLYYGTEQERLLQWSRALQLLEAKSVQMGKEYDSPDSKERILPFITSFQLEGTLDQLKKENPADYGCFNEFFARELKDGARPIAEPNNGLVVSSPADCRLTAYTSIDLATKFWIKGRGFTLAKLLGSDELAAQFEGGSIVIARLAPQDYHRFHAPINGVVQTVTPIAGAYYTVNPQAVNETGIINVFCENKRSVMILRRAETGSLVAQVAVGAMLVGSIEYNPGLEQPGASVARGQCVGCFKYGGSTVINVYPKGEVTLDADLVRNSAEEQCETLVSVGWRVGATERPS